MQTRRNFFGQLGTILALTAAPTIFVPTTPVHWGKPLLYVPKTYKLKALWAPDLAHDSMAYHGINVNKELQALLNQEIAEKFPGQEPLHIETVQSYDPVNWMPQHYHLVTINERVSI